MVLFLVSILALLVLITVVKLHPFLALLITAIGIGIADGMSLSAIQQTITKGIGDTIGPLILVLGCGVMLGSILTETGATQRISSGLIKIFGKKYANVAIVITSLVVGIALFYNAGFIVLIPLVFTMVHQLDLPLTPLVISMAAPLSVTHGFLPPHPGPTTIAVIFNAPIGKTLLYGLIVALPTLGIVGLIFPKFLKHIPANPPKGLFDNKDLPEDALPGFGISFLTALCPVILMTLSVIFHSKSGFSPSIIHFFQFVGDAGNAMLISVLFSILTLGIFQKKKISQLMNYAGSGLQAIASILLIIAAGGAMKEIFATTGIDKTIVGYLKDLPVSPLILGWLIATVIRIAIGSATIAGLTAAGIVAPMLQVSHVSPELMVLSIGAGSLMCSHLNDTGFWMFKEYVGLSVKDTFRSWTMMESLIGLLGLAFILLLSIFVS